MKLKRLVIELVDLGALQSGAFRLNLGPVDLRGLMDSCLETIQPDADQKGLKLESGLAAGVPSVIQADEERLAQVLLILLDNAVKFTTEGKITLVAARSHCLSAKQISAKTLTLAGSCLELRVSDTGPGLSEEDQVKILHLFSIMDGSYRGMRNGVSLSLAARLCTAMGGSLHVYSDGCCGSTFIVRLPLGVGAENPADATELAPVMPSGV